MRIRCHSLSHLTPLRSSVMSAKFDKLRIKLLVIWNRRGLTWKEVAVFLALAYFTPIGGSRAGTFHFPLVMFSHLIAMALLIGWTVQRFAQGRWLPKTPLDLPLLVFYLLNVISSTFSTEPRLSLENLLHLTIFVLIYYVAVDLLMSGGTVSSFVRPMLVLGSVIIIAELLEVGLWLGIWYAQAADFSPLLALGDYRRRIIMGPANVLAWYIVLLMPLALGQLLMVRSRRAKINLGAWVIGAFLVFISTLSRSGIVGMIVALAAFGVLTIMPRLHVRNGALLSCMRRPKVIARAMLTATLGCCLAALGLRLLHLRVGTIMVRFELWRAALEIVANRPLVGGGPGTFGYLFHQVPDFDPFAKDVFHSHAHNGYVNVAAETGLPSLLVGLWLIAVVAMVAWKGSRNLDDHSNRLPVVTNACFAGIFGLLAATLFDVPWVFPLTTLHVILLTAIIMKPYSIPRRLSTKPTRWMIPAVIALVAAMLIWTDTAHYFQYRAVEAIDDDNLPAGIHALQRAISIDPYLAVYRFQLGVAQGCLSLEEHDDFALGQAIAAFEVEISQGGDTAINNANLAWLEWRVGDPEAALNHMRRAVTLAPGRAYYQWGLGFLLEDVGDYNAATGAYSKAMEMEPALIDSGFWQANVYRRSIKADLLASDEVPPLALATMAYFARDYPKAIRLLDGVPQAAGSYCLRGQIETQQGNYGAALKHLNAAVEMAETNPIAYLARGELYLRMGDDRKAAHDLRMARFLGLKEADIMLGEMAYHAGDLDHAIARYSRRIPACRELEAPYYAVSVYHRSNLVVDFWPDSIACAPYDRLVPDYVNLARAYQQAGKSEQADDLCHWLTSFYEPAYLSQLDEGDENEWPCPDHKPDTSDSVGQLSPFSF